MIVRALQLKSCYHFFNDQFVVQLDSNLLQALYNRIVMMALYLYSHLSVFLKNPKPNKILLEFFVSFFLVTKDV